MKPIERLVQIEDKKDEIAKKLGKCSTFYQEHLLKRKIGRLDSESEKNKNRFPESGT